MRFEARHRFAKTVMSNTTCFIHVAKTVALRSQLQLAYSTHTDQLYRETTEVGPGTWSSLRQLDSDVAQVVKSDVGLGMDDDICIANWLKIGH